MAGTSLSGATLLVTGGGSGLGRQIALGAAARGARVVAWDLSPERGEAVTGEITAAGGDGRFFRVDVSDKEAVRKAAEETLHDVGPVDVIINNAGVVSGHYVLEGSEDAIEKTFAVNVLALYWVTRAFLPGMLDRGRGSVVTIASAAGLIGVARQTAYSASKHAAVGFSESLRAELRSQDSGIHTMVVCPYYVNTGMFAGVRTKVPLLLPILDEAEVARKVLEGIEKGRKEVMMPPLVRLLPVLRALPVAAFDWMSDAFGVNSSMDHFTGRESGGQVGPPTTARSATTEARR